MWVYICTLFAKHFPYIEWFEPILWKVQVTTGLYALESFILIMLVFWGLMYYCYTIVKDIRSEFNTPLTK